MAKYCGNCGFRLEDNDRVCGMCGTPCGNLPQVKPVDKPVKKKSGKKFGVIAAVVCVVLAVILIVVGIGALTGNGISMGKRGSYLNNDMLRSPTHFSKEKVTEINFLSTLSDAPSYAWDFSLYGDESVLAWMEGTHLFVAGDGGVILDEDASGLFGYVEVDEFGYPVEDEECYTNLVTINFNNSFDTSNVTNMARMFYGCNDLTSIDVSGFDTSNVTDMRCMFRSCSALETLDVSNFDTSNVTNMWGMFAYCSSLVSLDLSNFRTSNVTNMNWMFRECTSLVSLNVDNFDTTNVTGMKLMFYNCKSLVTLDLSSFYTPNVEYMQWMFTDCKSLVSLDISNFDMSNADTSNMFYGTTVG